MTTRRWKIASCKGVRSTRVHNLRKLLVSFILVWQRDDKLHPNLLHLPSSYFPQMVFMVQDVALQDVLVRNYLEEPSKLFPVSMCYSPKLITGFHMTCYPSVKLFSPPKFSWMNFINSSIGSYYPYFTHSLTFYLFRKEFWGYGSSTSSSIEYTWLFTSITFFWKQYRTLTEGYIFIYYSDQLIVSVREC